MLSCFIISTFFSIQTTDTITHQEIDEVVIVSATSDGKQRSAKGQAANIDEHLAELSHVALVRRGSYALEPTINNMQTERISTTIDGMKIFYACTDKMDPVTSYVESGNLQSISLNSGLNGNPQSTGNIGGSLDLKLRKVGFDATPHHISAQAGYESNGQLQVYGADVALSGNKAYGNAGLFFRHANNYKKGGGEEVEFSQFQKVNTFANLGFRLSEKNILESTFIYDRATDVGYPALAMDVSTAEGIIASLSVRHLFSDSFFNSWETKTYYNHIRHIMDDTHRPDVVIHMDMPGLSYTTGLYSLLTASTDKHQAQLNYDIYYNRLFADMTMYPGGAAPMYMVTWPDVGTLCTGLAASDNIILSQKQAVGISLKWAWQHQRINDDEGLKTLSIFFPKMHDAYYQIIGRVAAHYTFAGKIGKLQIGGGWGSRAPTVTEAYGYYLNNIFDQYDYIGSPQLKNESAFELNALARLIAIPQLSITAESNAFFFSNYIIGQHEERLSPMTLGAKGVKIYNNINHATISNTTLRALWQPLTALSLNAEATYATGTDDEGDNLPLIAPFTYKTTLAFSAKKITTRITLIGNAEHSNYGKKYGETSTDAYAIVNFNAQYDIATRYTNIALRLGVENIADRNYTTYSDWCHIPQKGRNIYFNVAIDF